MKFNLTKKQLDYARDLATKRHEAKNKSFRNKDILISDDKSDKKLDKNYLPHYIGVVGELAWSIVSDSEVDENIYSVRDPGEDFDGVEVKTITYMGSGEPELKIKVEEFNSKKPELYVLVRFDLKKTVEVLGTISRADFESHKRKKRYGARMPHNYVVPLSKMDKFS